MPSIKNIKVGNRGVFAIGAKQTSAPFPVDGVSFDGSESISRFGVCDTAAGTAAKTATIDSTITLAAGASVAILFTNGNTATNPTLNINSTGANAIKLNGTTAAGNGAWAAGETLYFVYDGTYWQAVNSAHGSENGAGRVKIDATLSVSGEAADAAALGTELSEKQDVVPAQEGQYLGFDAEGNAVAVTPDAEPTNGSHKLATSGGIDAAILNQYKTATITDVAVASFSDGADDIPVKVLTVNIAPAQSGSGNPYPPGSGASIWDEEWELGRYNQDTGAKVEAQYAIRSKNYIPVSPSTSYFAYCGSTGLRLFFYNSSKVYLGTALANNVVFQTPADAYYMTFHSGSQANPVTFYAKDISINFPSTVTTYSPYSNVRPISGWTGANVTNTGNNLANMTSSNIVVGKYINNSGVEAVSVSNYYNAAYIQVSPSAKYTASFSASICYFSVMEYDSDFNFIRRTLYGDNTQTLNNCTITTSAITAFIRFGANLTGATISLSDVLAINWMLNSGESALPYEPFGAVYPVSWQTEAGTVYGGTLDVTTGLLTIEDVRVDLGSLTWNYNGTYATLYSTSITDVAVLGANQMAAVMCSHYKAVGNASFNNNGWGSVDNNSIGFVTNGQRLCVKDSNYNGGALFKAAIEGRGYYLIYKLAVPQTVPLTPTEVKTMLGANNIFADTGDINILTYRRDITAVIAEALAGN